MRIYSETAWTIASAYSHVLASKTRDLAAWIDKALADEREQCARIAEIQGMAGDPSEYHRTAQNNVAVAIRARALEED